jgi:hypothetical protein
MTTLVGGARRTHFLLLLGAACSSHGHAALETTAGPAVSRGDDCTVAQHVEVPLDLFGELADPPRIVPFGDRFGLLASESATQSRTANAALVSWQGVEQNQAFSLTELCPDDLCRNVHGTGLLARASGDPEFVLAEQGSITSMPAYPLRLMAWNSDASEPVITPLFDARVTAITTRADLQSSRDAARAVFVLGNIDETSLEAAEIDADAALVAEPFALTLASAPWDCLSAVPTDEAAAISVVTKLDGDSEVLWSVEELDAQANVVFDSTVSVPVGDALGYADCPTVVESPTGFLAQWVSSAGASVIATVKPSAALGENPELLSLEASPGTLAGMLGEELLFFGSLAGEDQGFLRLRGDGEPGGAPIVLPPLPASTLEHRRAPPTVLKAAALTLDVSYELESARVFEQIDCR